MDLNKRKHHNKPIELCSAKVIKQRIVYIQNNLIENGFVTNPKDIVLEVFKEMILFYT